MANASRLDVNYHSARVALTRHAQAAVTLAWERRTFGDDSTFTSPAIIIVQAGMLKMASLVSGYFSMKTRVAEGAHVPIKAVDPAEYDIAKLRGLPADEVYGRPFGTVAALMNDGAEFFEANNTAASYVRTLVSTDMQLAQTHAAHGWIEQHG